MYGFIPSFVTKGHPAIQTSWAKHYYPWHVHHVTWGFFSMRFSTFETFYSTNVHIGNLEKQLELWKNPMIYRASFSFEVLIARFCPSSVCDSVYLANGSTLQSQRLPVIQQVSDVWLVKLRPTVGRLHIDAARPRSPQGEKIEGYFFWCVMMVFTF